MRNENQFIFIGSNVKTIIITTNKKKISNNNEIHLKTMSLLMNGLENAFSFWWYSGIHIW